MKILLIEDDKESAVSLATLLRNKGHDVEAVENGAQAYDRLNAGHLYHLIITDLLMPLMTGFEFMVKVRKEKLVHCPIVVSTGADPEWTSGIAGPDYLLPKPVNEFQLDTILSCVEKQQGAKQP